MLVAILTDVEAMRDAWALGYDTIRANDAGKIYVLDVLRKDAPSLIALLKEEGYKASYI